VILEGSVHNSVTAMQSEEEEVPDDEEQETIKKMKEKVQHTSENKEKRRSPGCIYYKKYINYK